MSKKREMEDKRPAASHSFTSKLSLTTKAFTDKFTDHPRSVGESYLAHMVRALMLAALSFLASLCFAVHSILPFIFTDTGSKIIAKVSKHLPKKREK